MNAGGPNLSLNFVGVLGFAVRNWPEPMKRGFNPQCILRWPDRERCNMQDAEVTRLDDFLAANSEEFTRSEVQSIVDALAAGKPYCGGGGAAERWTLENIGT